MLVLGMQQQLGSRTGKILRYLPLPQLAVSSDSSVCVTAGDSSLTITRLMLVQQSRWISWTAAGTKETGHSQKGEPGPLTQR